MCGASGLDVLRRAPASPTFTWSTGAAGARARGLGISPFVNRSRSVPVPLRVPSTRARTARAYSVAAYTTRVRDTGQGSAGQQIAGADRFQRGENYLCSAVPSFSIARLVVLGGGSPQAFGGI